MAQALKPFGVELVMAGRSEKTDTWEYRQGNDIGEIAYNPTAFPVARFSRALKLGGYAAKFYQQVLPSLFTEQGFDGAIGFSSQHQVLQPVLEICQANNKPMFADVVEWFGWNPKYLLNGVLRQQTKLLNDLLPKLDGLIGISHFWNQWSDQQNIPNVWIPSFLGEIPATQRTTDDGAPFTIAFMGHWIERELPRTILGAMDLCLSRGIDIRMNVIGNVGKSIWEKKAVNFLNSNDKLREKVHFLGFLSEEEKEEQLVNASAFIILRQDCRETDALFPTRLPEYMATSNPLILSDVGSFSSCFKHRKDVWFVSKENSVEKVAEAFEHLAKNEDERQLIGQQGRESALKLFSPDVLGKRLSEFLHTVSSTKKGPIER